MQTGVADGQMFGTAAAGTRVLPPVMSVQSLQSTWISLPQMPIHSNLPEVSDVSLF